MPFFPQFSNLFVPPYIPIPVGPVDNAVLYYAFSNGAELDDSTGNGYTLEDSGTTAIGSGGIIGYAATFDENTVLYSTNTIPNTYTNISLSLWAKSETEAIAFNVGNRDDSSGEGTFRLISVSGTTLVWQIASSGDKNCVGTFVNDGTWQHIVGTYDGSNMKLYVNGSLQTTLAIANATLSASKKFIIGGQWNAQPNFSANAFGSVDEIAFYDYALTEAQVAVLYNSGNGLNPYL